MLVSRTPRMITALALTIGLIAASAMASPTVYGRLKIDWDEDGTAPQTARVPDATTIGKGRILGHVRFKHSDFDEWTRSSVAIKGSYGLGENLDVKVAPRFVTREDDFGFDESGIGDTRIGVKWGTAVHGYDLYIQGGLSLPTGDEDKRLGTGEIGYSGGVISGYDWGKNSAVIRLSLRESDGDVSFRYGGEYLRNLSEDFGLNAGAVGSESDDRSRLSVFGGGRYKIKGIGLLTGAFGVGATDDSADWDAMLSVRRYY